MGGWELISWSLVSMQSLDGSPCLAASSQPTPAPSVSLWLPIGPRSPLLPSRHGQAVAPRVPQHCQRGRGLSAEAPARGRKEQLLFHI